MSQQWLEFWAVIGMLAASLAVSFVIAWAGTKAFFAICRRRAERRADRLIEQADKTIADSQQRTAEAQARLPR